LRLKKSCKIHYSAIDVDHSLTATMTTIAHESFFTPRSEGGLDVIDEESTRSEATNNVKPPPQSPPAAVTQTPPAPSSNEQKKKKSEEIEDQVSEDESIQNRSRTRCKETSKSKIP